MTFSVSPPAVRAGCLPIRNQLAAGKAFPVVQRSRTEILGPGNRIWKDQGGRILCVIFHQSTVRTNPSRDGSGSSSLENKCFGVRERGQLLLTLTAPVRSIPNADITYDFRASTLGAYSR